MGILWLFHKEEPYLTDIELPTNKFRSPTNLDSSQLLCFGEVGVRSGFYRQYHTHPTFLYPFLLQCFFLLPFIFFHSLLFPLPSADIDGSRKLASELPLRPFQSRKAVYPPCMSGRWLCVPAYPKHRGLPYISSIFHPNSFSSSINIRCFLLLITSLASLYILCS